ncbi:MAG: Tn7 transposase TnsA N-terminal domain-containing protein [Candidatus Binatia bacterium]
MAKYYQGWAKGFKKSPRAQAGEWYDSGWELQYMRELELDPMVKQWTRHHGLRIPYRKWWGGKGYYEPDFLVKIEGGQKELREVKGTHLLLDLNTKHKFQAGEAFCRQRDMVFKVITKTHVDPSDWSIGQGMQVEDRASKDSFRQSQAGEALKGERDLSGVYQALIWVALLLLVLYLLMR